MRKLKIFILFLLGVLPFLSYHLIQNNLTFKEVPENAIVLVNGYELDPPFNKDIQTYEALTLNTQAPNIFSIDQKKKTFFVSTLQKDTYIGFIINNKKYRLRTRPLSLPDYQVKSYVNPPSKGEILTTVFHGSGEYPSFALLLNQDGILKFYHGNENKKFNLSDFKKYVLPNGSIRYSFMRQIKPMPPMSFWYGVIVVLDENFQKIAELKQVAPTFDLSLIENHDSLILDDTHFILSRYQTQERYFKEMPIRLDALLLQEIKEGKVIFQWNSADYPSFYPQALYACWYGQSSQDYIHFNSLIIDPKDNNFIVSFAGTSSIHKINRQTGDIMWQLGGKNDEFGLKQNQFFTYQHTATLTQDGFLMLYDNHRNNIPPDCIESFQHSSQKTSRILKFKLDEKNKKLLDFQELPLSYLSFYMGNVFETLDNTYIVGYGSFKRKSAQEIDKKGRVLWEMTLPETHNTYRVYKMPLK